MQNRGLIIVGAFLIALGVISILGAVFDVDMGEICWPVALILIGVGLLLGPRLKLMGEGARLRPFGEESWRRGAWQVQDEEIWTFVGDIKMDLTQADIPPGETCIRAFGFVGNIRLILPPEVGYSISSTAFLNELKLLGKKQSVFASTVRRQSEGYPEAQRKIRLETLYFVLDLKVSQD